MEPVYDPENLFKTFDPGQAWFKDNKIAKALEYYLWEFSNLNAPRQLLERINHSWIAYYSDLFQNCHARRILIMGSGFGVLPLLAAGRDREVYACDRYPVLARISQEIINLNTTQDTGHITFFFKDLRDLKIGEDLPAKCDLFVFDDFDNTLLETGFVILLEHAKKHLLSPDAEIIPRKATVFARCVELSIDNSQFDLSPLEEYQWAVGSRPFDTKEISYRWLSEPVSVFHFDFSRPLAVESRKIPFHIIRNGRWNGMVYWHDLFSTPAYSLQYVDSLAVKEGMMETVTVYQMRTKIRFEPRTGVEKQKQFALQSWHINMVNDTLRNKKYLRAISNALKDKGDCRVLDIGSGCGLLSLIAARANPSARVDACEILDGLCKTADRIVLANGYADRIRIIHSDIRRLKLEQKVDIVIHEVIASGMLGEGVLHFLDYIQKNLMHPGTVVIPKAARVRGMCIEHRISQLFGYNVEQVNAYRRHPDYSSIDLSQTDYRKLSEPFDIFDFDFTKVELKPQAKEIMIPATGAGVVNAVAYWFDLVLDEETVLSTSPFERKTRWCQAIQYLHEISVTPGTSIPLKLGHDCYKIHFKIIRSKPDSSAALSPVPGHDQHWAARFYEIEKQYQEMILKAASREDTFQVLIDAAIRIASDPGQFGIRSKYASRLAESFFIQ